ncbi:MAG: class I SAM-dependent methyltransferase [Gemmatimonadota bacterium]|nr:class I SAM-dependent methyltransferase [Gemmatimonadota bacterium]
MTVSQAPLPDVMTMEREEWAKQLNLCNFVNAYYQFRDVATFGDVKSILMVGPGQGLETAVLRWRGFEVTTLDIDTTFVPDHVGSIHQMDMFADHQFDAVIASHVLEHLAVPYLSPALQETARVGRHALIYLPVAGRHVQARFQPSVKGIDVSLIMDLFNYFEAPDGVTPKYCERMHFWEVGMRGFRVRDLKRLFQKNFDVIRSYRNRDWNPSYNFLLRSTIFEK